MASLIELVSNGTCFITHLPITEYRKNFRDEEYLVESNGTDYKIRYDSLDMNIWSQDPDFIKFLDENRHLFRSAMYNNRWISIERSQTSLIKKDLLQEILNNQSFPKSPKEKRDFLLIELYSRVKWETLFVPFASGLINALIYKCYFESRAELAFYYNSLINDQIIHSDPMDTDSTPSSFKPTYKGLSEYMRLSEEGQNSNRCFVAMSFDNEDQYIFEAIRQACYEANKYEAFTVRDEHLDSVQTINDGIIAGIKKSKFCIADFTKQKDGVYFESGYAAGRGMKVIYTCHKDYWDATHFDTKHFPHIIYENTDQLKKQLIDKIQAWID